MYKNWIGIQYKIWKKNMLVSGIVKWTLVEVV